MPIREPLGLIDHNRPLPPSSPFPASSSSSSRKPLKLAPIFTTNSRTPRCPPVPSQENSSPTPYARKRARLDLVNDDEEENVVEPLKYGQRSSMTGFFSTTGAFTSSAESRQRAEKVVEVVSIEPSPEPTRPGWSRRRVRFGVNGGLASNLALLGIRSTRDLYQLDEN